MDREMQELLDRINAKKKEVRQYASVGSVAAAKKSRKELDELQALFDTVKDLDDDMAEDTARSAGTGTARMLNQKPDKRRKVKAFVNLLTAGILKREADAEDVKIYNAMVESTDAEGGLVVPQDIQTEIKELRRTQDDIEQYVNVEPVKTKTGSRVVEKEADTTPWDNVDEEAAFPDAPTPQFENVPYKVSKKGGILKITEELLQDTPENVMGYLKRYIAKKSRATRNAFILKVLKDAVQYGTEGSTTKAVNGIDGLKDVFNVDLDPAIADNAVIITNQNGFNYLDKLKDSDGDYILQPDPTKATAKILFGMYPVIKLSNKTLKTREIKDSQNKTTGYAYPVICGDLTEAITLFDREYMSIEISNTAGDLWEKDETGVKVRDRFDVKQVDKNAFVFGEITEAVNG